MERQGMPDPEQVASATPTTTATDGIAPLVATLHTLRARARVLLIVGSGGTLLGIVVGIAIAAGVIDFVLRTPAWLRLLALLAGLVALGWAARRHLLPALRFRPSLTEVALRLERSAAGRAAGLSGVLASGLELALGPPEGPVGRGMASHVVHRAVDAARQVRASAILTTAPAQRGLLVLAATVAMLGVLTILAGPSLMATGAMRIMTPWAGAEWPKRTGVMDATTATVHPLGTALPLRAALVHSDWGPENTRITVRYRLISPDSAGDLRRATLAWQGRPIGLDLSAPGQPAQGELFERLVEPSALVSGDAGAGQHELEYWFETEDDRTRPRRIRLVHPPAVVNATASITRPQYAHGAAAGDERRAFVAGQRELGPGVDQRAVVGPVLAGSRIVLDVTLNKAVPAPDAGDTEAQAAWLAQVLPGIRPEDDVASHFDGSRWRLEWTAARSLRVGIQPVDEHGIAKIEDAGYSFDIVEDRPPTATIIEPREDEMVLPTAVVEIVGEGRDDVGLSGIALEAQHARPPAGSPGAAPEAAGKPQPIQKRTWEGTDPAPTHATLRHELALSNLELRPRDELWITALVQDNFLAADGSRHEPVRSAPRRLRIISEDELIDQIRAELSAMRRVAMRLDEEQAHVQDTVRTGEFSDDDVRRQAGLTQRIQQQRSAIERLTSRVERNRLDDEALSGLVEDIDTLLRDAARQSDRAAAQMDSAMPADERTAEVNPEEARAINEPQELVRDHLGQLAEMLDRGEDTWIMSRTLQRLLQQQRDLQAQTQRLGEQTMGRRAEDLSPEERAQLERLRERQEQLAQTMRQALDDLQQRAEQMRDADPAQAEAMQQAADRGRQQQVDQRMQEAGENLEQNQTSTASSQQQEAIDALEQMVADMDDAQRQRDQALRRILAGLIESIQVLIEEQTSQLALLEEAVPAQAFEGLDSALIALNQNTLAVADTARSDRATAPVAEPLDRAARAQSDAVASLRASPVNAARAEQHQNESLRLLNEALQEAQRLQREAEQRDQQRLREDLRRIYREVLEEQVALRSRTEPYIGRQIDRRDRMSLRGLGERQETLRQQLEEARARTEEIEEAAVFAFAHQRLDTAMAVAGKHLRAGQANRSVERNQDSAVRILASLVEALEELQRDDEFRDEEGGGGGGGGGQDGGQPPLIPPIAELRLLRGMQHETLELTRALDEADDPAAREELPMLGELQQALAERGRELMHKLQQPPSPEAPLPELPQPDVPQPEAPEEVPLP